MNVITFQRTWQIPPLPTGLCLSGRRIALIYALLDDKTEIDLAHIKAGLAVWEFCEESARQIFGDSLGDPVADTILGALRAAGMQGSLAPRSAAYSVGIKPRRNFKPP